MVEKEFNLLQEPWILVIRTDGKTEEVSILDLFRNADAWRGLAGELPTQDFAILRLLLAILHAVFGRYDHNGSYSPLSSPQEALSRWKLLWSGNNLPYQIIEDYLLHYSDRFWLFHSEHPFYQVPRMEKATAYTAAKLIGELSESSNKVRLFPQRAAELKAKMRFAEAARWLLYANAFDDTSAKPKGKGLPSPGAGWLGKLGLIMAVGDNLRQTLLLNLVLLKNGEDHLWGDERPLWEKEVKTEERTAINVPDNPSELLTLQSRRLLLERQGAWVTGYSLLGGDFFPKGNAFTEQMTLWRNAAKNTSSTPEFNPKRHDPARQIWRDFSILLAQSQAGHRPGIVNWLSRLKRQDLISSSHFRFQTAAVSYGDKDFFVKDLCSDSIQVNTSLLATLGQHWSHRIVDEIELVDLMVQRVGELAQDLAKATGDTNGTSRRTAAKEQAYYRLDSPFRTWLEKIDPARDEIAETCDLWWREAQQITRNFGRELVEHAGPRAFTGRLVRDGGENRLYTAPHAFNRFLFRTENRETLKDWKR